MTDRSPFLTRTMAGVHLAQGNLDKAAEIYRFLVRQDPDNAELSEALTDLESQMQQQSEEGLQALFRDWIHMASALNRINKLNRLKDR